MLNTYSESGSAGFPRMANREGWVGWDEIFNAAADMPNVFIHRILPTQNEREL